MGPVGQDEFQTLTWQPGWEANTWPEMGQGAWGSCPLLQNTSPHLPAFLPPPPPSLPLMSRSISLMFSAPEIRDPAAICREENEPHRPK